jgi:hypothetical protein
MVALQALHTQSTHQGPTSSCLNFGFLPNIFARLYMSAVVKPALRSSLVAAGHVMQPALKKSCHDGIDPLSVLRALLAARHSWLFKLSAFACVTLAVGRLFHLTPLFYIQL